MSNSRLEGLSRMLLVVLVCMTFAIGAFAQSTTEGAIGGTVYDAQGAVVAKAAVTVRNIGTNAQQTTTTDANGYFRVIRLSPAVYEVTVSSTGFANYKASSVTVNVGSVTEISAKLNPGGASEVVEVRDQAPQVNTTSAEFAPVVDEAAIKNLPINGGRWSNFVLLTPGVVNDSSGFGLVSFRGMSILQNNNTVDGADNNQAFFAEERGRTRAGYSTAKAAVQEFQVNTSNYSVEYGRAVGGVVNTVTKSGSNALHGEAYFFDRDNNWGATNPVTTLTDTVAPFTARPFKAKDWRKMIGTGVGGPIIKDKLFFFFAYDYFSRNFPGLGVASSPKSFFAAQTVTSTNITQLAGNLGITTAAALTLYNNDLGNLATTLGTNNRNGTQYIYLPKIDWVVNSKNHLSFVFNRMNWDSPSGIQTQSSNTYGRQSFGNDYVRINWGVLKLNTALTSNLVNEFRTQYGRDFEFENPQQPTTAYETANLLNSALYPAYHNPTGTPPEVFITNGWTIGTANFLNRTKYPDERRQQYADTLSWTKGKHTFKFGGDFTNVSDDTQNLRYQFGSYSYSNLANYFTDLHRTLGGVNALASSACRAIINGVANTAVPCYSSYNQAVGPLGFKFSTNDYGFFAQDDWKILPRLTVSLGVRYDYQQLTKPFAALVNPDIPQTGKIPNDSNNIGPRVGFAWDLFGDGKSSLRGGFAVTYGRTINSTLYNALTNTGVDGAQLQYTVFNNAVTTANASCAIAFPQVYLSKAALQACSSSKPGVAFFQSNFQSPKVYHVNLSIDHQFTPSTVLSLSYLGSFGRDLPLFVDTNIDPTSKFMTTFLVCGVNGDTTSCGHPLPGQPIQDATITVPVYTARLHNGLATDPRALTDKLWNKYGAMTEIRSAGTSNYQALVVQLNRRMSRSFQFNSNFTWSHAIDFGQNNTTFTSANGVLDPYDLSQEKGNSNQNVPRRLVVSGVWQSPWKHAGWLSYLTNDWQVAPLWQYQSGLPYSARTSGNTTTCASCAQPVAGLGGMNGSNGDFRLYNSRNQFAQQNTQVWDLKVAKSLKARERYSAELSAEVFNLFNHQNVTAVNATAYFVGTSGSNRTLTYNTNAFGVPTNVNSNFAYSQRQVQLGVKVKF